jgi:hypothetical protein
MKIRATEKKQQNPKTRIKRAFIILPEAPMAQDPQLGVFQFVTRFKRA